MQFGGPPFSIEVRGRPIIGCLLAARPEGGLVLATWRRAECGRTGLVVERCSCALAGTLAIDEDDCRLGLEYLARKGTAYVRCGVCNRMPRTTSPARIARRVSSDRRQGRTCFSRAYARISSALEGITETPWSDAE